MGDKSILDIIKDAISTREDSKDKKSRVGKGGQKRRSKIDAAVDSAVSGRARQREGQTTDSNQ